MYGSEKVNVEHHDYLITQTGVPPTCSRPVTYIICIEVIKNVVVMP